MKHPLRNTLYLVFSFVLAAHGCLLAGQTSHPPSVPEGKREDMPSLTFDVASIRESDPDVPVRQQLNNPNHAGSLDAVMRLSQLVGAALGVNFRFQLAGGPEWLDEQNFVIHARTDEEVDRQLASLTDEQATAEKRRMLLHLLEERFALKYHVEQRPEPAYFLTFSKDVPGLRPGTETTGSGIASGGPPTDLLLTGHGAKFSQFVGLMSYYLKAPVIDQTGLEGMYDFKVHFNARPDLSEDVDAGPLPEQALSEQMGLRLVRGKAPTQVVVIDSVSKPTPN
jgi:uncharacterized protein (TIGR03435 family)